MKTSGKSWAKYIDGKKKARKSGYRKSKVTGERYYEDRPDHSDDDPKTRLAHGGMTEHGLKVNDTIKSGGGIRNTTIRVHNSNFGDARVDLDKGKRTPLKFNSKTKKYEEKMAKGGKTKKGKKEPMVVRGYFDDEPYEYAKGGGVKQELYRLYDPQDDNFKEIIGNLSQINDFLDEQGENGNYDNWVEGDTFSNADKYGLYLEKIDKYAKGGAIYKGDKVRIKDTNKSMVVKNIQKGKKGYVEFSGDKGTYLKGDLKKYEKGGMTSGWCYSIGGL